MEATPSRGNDKLLDSQYLREIHQEIKNLQLTSQQNLDAYRDLFLEFKKFREEVSALVQYCSRKREGGEPCCGSQDGEAAASAPAPPRAQGSPPEQQSRPPRRLVPIASPSVHRRLYLLETPIQEPPPIFRAFEHNYTAQLNGQFSRFGSGDPTDWFFRCEICFRYYSIPASDFIRTAALYLDEPAFSWHRIEMLLNPWHTWESFKWELFRTFVDVMKLTELARRRIPHGGG